MRQPGRGAVRRARRSALLLDRSGWLWIGGFGLGLQRHHPGPVALRVRGADGAVFPGGNARSLLVWRAPSSGQGAAPTAPPMEQIWAGTPADGVAIFGTALRGQARLELPGPGAGRVEAMAQWPDDSLLDPAVDRLFRRTSA